jgi:hypothetical protein
MSGTDNDTDNDSGVGVPVTGTLDAYVIEASTGIAGVRSKKNAPNPTIGIQTHAVMIRPQPNQVPVLTR